MLAIDNVAMHRFRYLVRRTAVTYNQKHIENEECICYNAIRQGEVGSQMIRLQAGNPRAATLGFSISLLMAEQIHRLVTDYLSLSTI